MNLTITAFTIWTQGSRQVSNPVLLTFVNGYLSFQLALLVGTKQTEGCKNLKTIMEEAWI